MDRVVLVAVLSEKLESVALMELEGVVRLRRKVDSDDLEAGTGVTHAGTAGATEEVEQSRLHFFALARLTTTKRSASKNRLEACQRAVFRSGTTLIRT